MIVRLNVALRNKILDCMFNTGSSLAIFDSGTAEFRTGAQPATGDTAASGTVVATVGLAADAMAAAAAGSVSKNSTTWQDISADATGTIGWARFKSADGLYTMDFDVSDNAGTGAIKVDNPAVIVTQQFIVTSFTLTMPGTT